MSSETLLREISEYCRQVGMAESTFGRLAVNDGKLVSRLRFGGRVTTETLPALYLFPKDMEQVPAEVNRLNNQVLVRYYEDEWRRWN